MSEDEPNLVNGRSIRNRSWRKLRISSALGYLAAPSGSIFISEFRFVISDIPSSLSLFKRPNG